MTANAEHTDAVREVLDAGPDQPRRSPPARLVVALVLAAFALVVGLTRTSAFGRDERPPRPATAATPSAPAPAATRADCTTAVPARELPVDDPTSVSALVFGSPAAATALTRLDTTAGQGPWTVVVRRDDGSLGRHGAVVTFPVRAADASGNADVVWALAGAQARVRGDLGRATLLEVARRTIVVHGRPVVRRPPDGLRVIASQPYRPREVHELRYRDRRDLGEVGAVLGFVYTGVLRGGGFEDALYAGSPAPAGTVHGQAAVVSPVLGGSATLAWSPEAGVVAYVGYSGPSVDEAAVAALRCLARRTRPLTEAQWRAAAPFVVAQTNDFG